MSKLKNEDVIKIYKVVSYLENILDTIDKMEHKNLPDKMQHIYKSCNNFKNRILSKKNTKHSIFLDAIFDDGDGGLGFTNYRDEVDKAIDSIFDIPLEGREQLIKIRESTFKDNNLLTDNDLISLIVQSKLTGDNAPITLEKWKRSKMNQMIMKSTSDGGLRPLKK